ncbi:hypothetical protein HGRIS_003869 [Hohenbuehelia grisea]|uniref:Uncharacterized protein n=1 Tax=Hohenbuehelia grisea TaxID=104357 RepID=A0ABR3JH85_9AGAR
MKSFFAVALLAVCAVAAPTPMPLDPKSGYVSHQVSGYGDNYVHGPPSTHGTFPHGQGSWCTIAPGHNGLVGAVGSLVGGVLCTVKGVVKAVDHITQPITGPITHPILKGVVKAL